MSIDHEVRRPWGTNSTVAVAVLSLAVLGVLAMLLVFPAAAWSRWCVAAVLAAVLGAICWRAPHLGVLVTLGWLFFLGANRRVVSWQLVDVAKDPLLLVGPAALAVLAARAALAGALRRRTALAVLVGVFSVVALLGVLNPKQDSFVGALAGLLFWLVPMVWFWVGRGLVDNRLLDRVIGLAAVAGVVSAVYGLLAAAFGNPPWDTQWLRDHGYAALYVGGPDSARPFGLAASAVEYGLIVALGAFLIALFAARSIIRHNVRAIASSLGALGLCVLALVVSGVRTAVVMLAVTVVCSLVVRLRPRAGVVLALAGLVVVAYGALWLVPAERWTQDGSTGSVRRIVVGLRDPFDRGDSTLLGHVDMVRFGIEDGFEEPLGNGTGSTNLAGEQFSDAAQDTEFDISNGAVAFGIPGMLFTAVIFVVGMILTIVSAWRRPDLRRLAVLGIVLLSFRFWWNGGHYFLSAVLWLVLGWLDVNRERVSEVARRRLRISE